MSIHNFNPKFLSDYKISGFFQAEKRRGQKSVYFPIVEGENLVLKLFPGGQDERFDREMEIYEKFVVFIHLKQLGNRMTINLTCFSLFWFDITTFISI